MMSYMFILLDINFTEIHQFDVTDTLFNGVCGNQKYKSINNSSKARTNMRYACLKDTSSFAHNNSNTCEKCIKSTRTLIYVICIVYERNIPKYCIIFYFLHYFILVRFFLTFFCCCFASFILCFVYHCVQMQNVMVLFCWTRLYEERNLF